MHERFGRKKEKQCFFPPTVRDFGNTASLVLLWLHILVEEDEADNEGVNGRVLALREV